MYEAFYGFKERPFSLTPDPDFLYEGPTHKKAVSYLANGLESGEGFVLVTGDIGTGKTTIVRHVIRKVRPHAKIAHIVNPRGTFRQLMRLILDDLGAAPFNEELTRERLLAEFEKFVRRHGGGSQPVILILDEAQNLDPVTLEEIRMLSNFETDKQKLVQIILAGQAELKTLFELPRLKPLEQRISTRCHLSALSREETTDYIRHRLAVSGAAPDALRFTRDAFEMIYIYSRGIPRRINIVCNAVLLAGFVDGKRAFTARYIQEIMADLRQSAGVRTGVHELEVPADKAIKVRAKRGGIVRKTALAGAAAVVAGVVSWLVFFDGYLTLKTAIEKIF